MNKSVSKLGTPTFTAVHVFFVGLAKLRRLRKVLPTRTKKYQLYNALVLPHTDICSVVWQECSRELRQKLERVQNYGMGLMTWKGCDHVLHFVSLCHLVPVLPD